MNNAIDMRHEEPVTVWWTLLVGLFLWLLIVTMFVRFLGKSESDVGTLVPIDAQIIELPATPKAATKPTEKRQEKRPPKPIPEPRPEPEPHAAPTPEVTQNTAAKPSAESPPAAAQLGARAIYQPIPKIPEELRYEAIRAEAVARFHINVDGTVAVELIKPTTNPRINQIILNTLRTWKFLPALQNGNPVPSVQEIKIHVEVS